MHIPSIPGNLFTGAVSQVLTGAASRASSTVKSFESNLDSGNSTSGAQSFLSTLGQLSAGGSALSTQAAQVGSDLQSGDLNAAQTDFAQLRKTFGHLKTLSGAQESGSTSGSQDNSHIGATAAYNAMLQSAYSSAINLAMPGGTSSFSANL
jgi:hypothetical protein